MGFEDIPDGVEGVKAAVVADEHVPPHLRGTNAEVVSTPSLVLFMEIDLNRIIQTGQSLDAAVCAVIKQKNGNISYWAVTHKDLQADFHRRDSFIIEL